MWYAVRETGRFVQDYQPTPTVHSNMGRTSGRGLVPIEGPKMQSGDQRCGTLQD